MSEAWKLLTDYTARHHGVVSLPAARELGITGNRIKSFVRAGRLQRRAPGVYVVTGSPPSWHQRATEATASSAGWASHRTAAALWALDGFERRQVEVLTVYGDSCKRSGWRVHETRRLAGVDLDEIDGIPCTAVPRTILDLAAVVHPFQVGQALDNACFRWPDMLDVIVQRFLELAGRGRRGTRLLRGMLDERLGQGRFTQNGFETMARKLVRSVGLPDPIPQFKVQDLGFKAYIDLAWPPPLMLGLECDSLAWHSGKRAHEWDRQRRRQLKELGWDLIEVTYDDVTKRRAQTGRQLRDLYRTREAQQRATQRSDVNPVQVGA